MMWYGDYDDFSYGNGDTLIILKNDKPSKISDCYYDIHKNTMFIGDNYSHRLTFNGEEYRFLSTWLDRLEYAYASSRNDKELDDIVKSRLNVDEVSVPSERYTRKYYLKHWMEKYNFTLEDFIFNNKYIVISDKCHNRVFDTLVEFGMLDYDNIEACSAEEEND